MFCYFIRSKIVFLPIALLLYLVTYCHTVANVSENVDSTVSLYLSHLKRDDGSTKNSENLNQTVDQNVLDKASVVTSSHDIVSYTNPSVTENDFKENVNSTAKLPMWVVNSGALQRTGFVALGVMLIIVAFFIIRVVRLRHKRSKSRKYGIITSTDMEMEPLDKDDDDEEDATLFDAQHKYSLQ